VPPYRSLIFLFLLLDAISLILSFRYFLYLFLKCLLASCLTLLKLSSFTSLGSCNHCTVRVPGLKPWKECRKCEMRSGNEKKMYLILFRMKVLSNFAIALFCKIYMLISLYLSSITKQEYNSLRVDPVQVIQHRLLVAGFSRRSWVHSQCSVETSTHFIIPTKKREILN
jgi:hypothetical protein